ncbi:MAG: ATP-binding protein [Planctomycetota bacterium]
MEEALSQAGDRDAAGRVIGGPESRQLDLLHRKLRESEERYRMFVEHALDAIWCLETPLPIDLPLPPEEQARRWLRFGRVTECNDAFAQRVGAKSADQVRGLAVSKLTQHWIARPGDTFLRLAESRYTPQDRIAVEVDGEGEERHLRIGLFGVIGPDIIQRIWIVEQDITRQVIEDKELRESRDLYEAVIRTALDGICILDDDLHIVDCNAALEQLLGGTRGELLGLDARELVVVTRRDGLEPYLGALRSAGGWRGRVGVRCLDGSLRDVELSVRHTPTSGGRYYCFAQDVTHEVMAREAERRREAQMAHIARLSTLGEMASGIAHELNQPLAAIVNYATGAARRLRARGEADDELLRAIDQVGNQARRAGGIIQRMRSFAHKGDGGVIRCSLNQIVEETVGFLGLTSAGRRIRVELDLLAEPDEVLADPIRIEQVLVNLIRNAEDALEGMSSERAPRRPRIMIRTAMGPEPGLLEVQVEDEGPGLSPEAMAHLYTPFFTTKPSGLGLGLSISASIVHSHGGRLWVTPAPRTGACFHFTLAVPYSTIAP